MNVYEAYLTGVQYNDSAFYVRFDEDRPYLQVEYPGVDAVTGAPRICKGRKWLLSPHMTKSEVVQTALMAVLTNEEHEAREAFRYKGAAVFGPHYNIDDLLTVCETKGEDHRS